jgi:HD-GYP domain-containing protein (c-di-GMP phosphodiesterase class II)
VSNSLREAGRQVVPAADAVPDQAGALEALERFGLALQQCGQVHEQVDLALETIREALAADAVFIHPSEAGDGFEYTGDIALSAGWATAFFHHLPIAPDADRLVQHFLDPGARPMAPWPCSAALVRLSQSHGSWLAAVSFHPRRLFGSADLQVMLLARRMLLGHRQQAEILERLRDSLYGLVYCLTSAIDAKDPYTAGHSERVARIAVRLGKQMGLPQTVLSDLHLAGLLHDIGKIGIRDSVLQKPGELTAEETEYIRLHVTIGERMIAHIKSLQHLRPGIRNHHERFDGKGYPDGLSGESIPLVARILAVADSCDAMMSARPYRPGMEPDLIDAIMVAGAGTQWDPEIIAPFMACRRELYAICQRGLGDSVFTSVERALRRSGEESSRRVMALR